MPPVILLIPRRAAKKYMWYNKSNALVQQCQQYATQPLGIRAEHLVSSGFHEDTMAYKDKEKEKKKKALWRETNKEKMSAWRKEYNDKNRDKINASHKKYYMNNREKRVESSNARLLKINYGMTVEEYDALFILQGGVCAICGKPETAFYKKASGVRKLCVDHDHETGTIRGLLCGKCNIAIGLMNDDIGMLLSAIRYLEKARQK